VPGQEGTKRGVGESAVDFGEGVGHRVAESRFLAFAPPLAEHFFAERVSEATGGLSAQRGHEPGVGGGGELRGGPGRPPRPINTASGSGDTLADTYETDMRVTPASSNSGLSTGWYVLIAIGGALILALICWLLWRTHGGRPQAPTTQAATKSCRYRPDLRR
jgi:hypothetical protein